VVSAIGGLALYAAALFGAGCAARRQGGKAKLAAVITLLLASTAIHVASHSMVRFRIPYADPVLASLAGVGVAALRSHKASARAVKGSDAADRMTAA
jgi:hypothetical protein